MDILRRVVTVHRGPSHPGRGSDNMYRFGTVNGSDWYGVSLDTVPGMPLDLNDTLPKPVPWSFVTAIGRIEEV